MLEKVALVLKEAPRSAVHDTSKASTYINFGGGNTAEPKDMLTGLILGWVAKVTSQSVLSPFSTADASSSPTGTPTSKAAAHSPVDYGVSPETYAQMAKEKVHGTHPGSASNIKSVSKAAPPEEGSDLPPIPPAAFKK